MHTLLGREGGCKRQNLFLRMTQLTLLEKRQPLLNSKSLISEEGCQTKLLDGNVYCLRLNWKEFKLQATRKGSLQKKTPKFGTLSESGRGGLKNHKLFFQNLVWTFFNRGGGFCHHVQTVKS